MNEHTNYLYKIDLNKHLKFLRPILLVFLLNYLKSTFALKLNTIPQYGPLIKKNIINKLSLFKINNFFCNRCNISNTSYKDRLVKLGMEYLEYRR